MAKPRVVIFASGSNTGGGSGARMLVERSLSGELPMEVVGIVTHHANGGVAKLAWEHGIKLYVVHDFPVRSGDDFTDEQLQQIEQIYARILDYFGQIDFYLLSGWLKWVLGLPVEKTVNIHPGPVGEFGGPHKHGDAVHQAVYEAFLAGDLASGAITMHFVTPEFDKGPVIAQCMVSLFSCSSWQDVKNRVVGPTEHAFQAEVTRALLASKVRLEKGVVVWHPNFQFSRPEYIQGAYNC